MSRNSKNAQRVKAARERKGVKGPAKTTCKHNKKRAWYRIGNNNNGKRAGSKASVDGQAQTE